MFRRASDTLPPNFAAPPVPPATEENHGARPKFSRRPASFAATSEPPPAAASVATPANGRPPVTAATPWQEDIRFGIALIVLLVIINTALMVMMPSKQSLPAMPMTQAAGDIAANADTMPLPVHPDTAPTAVTFYEQPEEEQRAAEQLNLQQTDMSHNGLSIAPGQFPPPKAEPLDHSKSMRANINPSENQ